MIAKQTVCKCIDKLLDNKKSLVVNLGSMGVATLFEQRERYIVHLLYAIPTKRGTNVEVIEDICPIYGVELSLRVPQKIKRVYIAPQMKDVDYEIEGEYISVKNINIDCHQMVVFEKENF